MAMQTRVMDMSDLKDLEPLSKRLNTATDELNISLKTIEEYLQRLGIGLEVWGGTIAESAWSDVLDAQEEPTGKREYTETELGFGRFGDSWVLLVRTRRIVEDSAGVRDVYEGKTLMPLLRSSRAVRVAAVGAIPKLIDAIEEHAKGVIKSVEHAKKIADSLNH